MTNRKTTRRALFMSIISLMLCCAMLVGTTFAWFTDSVTSANNIIKSGTLDVEMYWADGTQAVPTDDNGWTDASTGAIFNYDLWEPGYTEVRHIKIANVGTLALKYQLQIVANGEVSKLSDVIDVYYADPAVQVADRTMLTEDVLLDDLTTALNNMKDTANGRLEAGESVTLTLALKMQETAGNEYQNLSIGSDFSVILQATQVEAEDDSFGNDYDNGSALPAYAKGTGTLDAGASAVSIEARLPDPVNDTKVASVLIPKEAVKDPDKDIMVTVTKTEMYEGVTVKTDEAAETFDIKVSNIVDNNQEEITVQLRIAAGLDPNKVKLYHYAEEIPCSYNPSTGYVTFQTAEFSPFTVVYDAESEYVAPEVEESKLPQAEVTPYTEISNIEWGKYGQWSPTEGLQAELETAYVFSCVETPAEAALNPYANWYCDFYVSLDRDLGENQLFLGGNYGSFGWVGFHNGDVTPSANTEIGLLEGVTTNPWTYLDVANYVGTFICGVGDVNNALTGATFTVKLRLTNPENNAEFYDVATITYKFATGEGTIVIPDQQN